MFARYSINSYINPYKIYFILLFNCLYEYESYLNSL